MRRRSRVSDRFERPSQKKGSSGLVVGMVVGALAVALVLVLVIQGGGGSGSSGLPTSEANDEALAEQIARQHYEDWYVATASPGFKPSAEQIQSDLARGKAQWLAQIKARRAAGVREDAIREEFRAKADGRRR